MSRKHRSRSSSIIADRAGQQPTGADGAPQKNSTPEKIDKDAMLQPPGVVFRVYRWLSIIIWTLRENFFFATLPESSRHFAPKSLFKYVLILLTGIIPAELLTHFSDAGGNAEEKIIPGLISMYLVMLPMFAYYRRVDNGVNQSGLLVPVLITVFLLVEWSGLLIWGTVATLRYWVVPAAIISLFYFCLELFLIIFAQLFKAAQHEQYYRYTGKTPDEGVAFWLFVPALMFLLAVMLFIGFVIAVLVGYSLFGSVNLYSL